MTTGEGVFGAGYFIASAILYAFFIGPTDDMAARTEAKSLWVILFEGMAKEIAARAKAEEEGDGT